MLSVLTRLACCVNAPKASEDGPDDEARRISSLPVDVNMVSKATLQLGSGTDQAHP